MPFAAIVLAMLPAVLDQTILATALPVVAGDLGQPQRRLLGRHRLRRRRRGDDAVWGKLGDRHGRKLLLEVALVVFVAASALCAAAQDITLLVVLRFVQGAAAGGLMTLAMAARRRPRRAARARPLPGLHRRHLRASPPSSVR